MPTDDPTPAPAPQPGQQPPAQAAPAQATAVPKLPLYITTRTPSVKYYPPPPKGAPPNPTKPEPADPIQWKGSDIPLWTFSFLGKSGWTPYRAPKEKTGVYGVNVDLADRLIDAQTNLYWKALAEAQQVDPKVVELSEEQFAVWCWSYQEPMESGVSKPGQVQGALGYKDAGNPESFHSSGSGIDINLMFNPYLPTRNGNVISGEVQNYAPDLFKVHPELNNDKAKHDLHVELIWGPAISLFDRAYGLSYGTLSDTSPNSHRDQLGASYDRFKRLSWALQTWFHYVYTNATYKNPNPAPKSQAEFETAFGKDFDDPDTQFDPNATFNGQNLKASMAADRKGTLQALYDQMVADRTVFQAGCVSGNLTINSNLTISFPGLQQRDPCTGVFNVRREVFMELVINQKLAWGGCMLGDHSGADTMHFDMNAHWVNGVEVPSKYRR